MVYVVDTLAYKVLQQALAHFSARKHAANFQQASTLNPGKGTGPGYSMPARRLYVTLDGPVLPVR